MHNAGKPHYANQLILLMFGSYNDTGIARSQGPHYEGSLMKT